MGSGHTKCWLIGAPSLTPCILFDMGKANEFLHIYLLWRLLFKIPADKFIEPVASTG